jgi:P-type Cu2+ transporter
MTAATLARAVRPDLAAFLRGEPGEPQRLDLAVEGIRCAGCMSTIERGVGALPGVVHARVNLTDRRLTVLFATDHARPDAVIEKLAQLGFKAQPFSPRGRDAQDGRELHSLLRALGVAAFAAMNIMLLSVVVWSGASTGLDPATRDLFHWISALIALPTAAYSGRVFFDSALAGLKARRVNMDVPISLGIVLALGMSVVQALNHAEHAYFDGAVMLMFFLLIGRVLEHLMQDRTRKTAANLAALKAERALKRLPDGSWKEMPIDMVEPGDLVMVRLGERVPLDGAVEEGRSDIDQSLVSGETAHRAVQAGDQIYAGALNVTGPLLVRVAKPHDGTMLAEIERLLATAAANRGRYVRLADRAARLYPPVVHTAALATFLGWMVFGLPWSDALVIAITVLIITCPCALGLAVPTVQIVASGAFFRRGLLLNSGEALERLAEVDRVVLDKTGTLTTLTTEVANRDELDPGLTQKAARLALASRHPLAAAVAALGAAGAPPATAREVPGQGVTACAQGLVLRLGSPAFCEAEQEAEALAQRFPDASLVAFRAGDLVQVFAVRQPLRADAAEVVQAFRAAGMPVEIASGDRPEAVEAVARRIGVADWRAGILPGGKVARLRELKAAGHRPMMIGDGLNDAPALAEAHASIAPVSAAHIAQARADVLMIGERLLPAAEAVALARRARGLMLANLWFSAAYNVVAIPIAVAGYATPLVAALAMSGSSIVVMLNALRAARPPAPPRGTPT